MKNSLSARILLFIAIIGIIGFLSRGAIWGMYIEYTQGNLLDKPASEQEKTLPFTIAQGENATIIASRLFDKRLILSKELFEYYVQKNNLSSSLQKGTYLISTTQTIPEVVDQLTGKVIPTQISVTIPEGYTVADIAQLLEDKGLTTKQEVLNCITDTCDFSDYDFLPKQTSAMHYKYSYMEGYLFPDTYFVDTASFSVETFLKRLLQTFQQKVIIGQASAIKSSGKDLGDIIIMASIIEKESRPKDDQNIVSGILWKRIDQGVQLATDATNRYIKADSQGEITYQDLTSSNPYNTRRQRGLPPSAISNPGLGSIKATLHPKDSEYWYYLHDALGTIHFSTTEAEHEQNKAKYLK